MTTFEPGSIGYAVGWLIGGPLDGIGYRDIPIFPDGEPGVRLVIPLDEAHREYGIYQRRACPWPNGRWYYDFVATTTNPDVTPATTNAESGPTSMLPAESQIHPSDAASSIIWPEANPATMALPAESAPWNGEVPARRFLLAQWWWVASELARRTNALRLMAWPSTHDPADIHLRVRDTRDSRNVTFKRTGGIILYQNDTAQRLPNADLFTTSSPHDIVKHIELELGWGGPTSPTTPRSLIYRLIAGIFGAKANDRHRWHVEQINDWNPERLEKAFHGFTQLPEALSLFDESGPAGVWAVLCDGRPVAVFVEDGSLLQRGKKRLNVAALYDNHHRDFDETLAHVLARVNQVPLERKQHQP
jgi:hypothetical protein